MKSICLLQLFGRKIAASMAVLMMWVMMGVMMMIIMIVVMLRVVNVRFKGGLSCSLFSHVALSVVTTLETVNCKNSRMASDLTGIGLLSLCTLKIRAEVAMVKQVTNVSAFKSIKLTKLFPRGFR